MRGHQWETISEHGQPSLDITVLLDIKVEAETFEEDAGGVDEPRKLVTDGTKLPDVDDTLPVGNEMPVPPGFTPPKRRGFGDVGHYGRAPKRAAREVDEDFSPP